MTSADLYIRIRDRIESKWPWTFTDPAHQLIDSYAKAFADCVFLTLSSLVFAPGIVSGGGAPPSGPVVGAQLSYSAGSLTYTAMDLESVFVPPNFRVVLDDGTALTGSYTPWLKCFTSTLSSTVNTCWDQYATAWFMSGAPVAGGGVAAWVASTPPAPGPWTQGTILTPFVFHSPSTGQSAFELSLLSDLFVTSAMGTSVTIPIPASSPITTALIATTHAEKMARAFTDGFSEVLLEVLQTILVWDPSGIGGTGVAAPGGIITGTLSGARLQIP